MTNLSQTILKRRPLSLQKQPMEGDVDSILTSTQEAKCACTSNPETPLRALCTADTVQINTRVTDGPCSLKGQADAASAGPGEESVGRNGPARKAWSQS